MTAFRFGTFAYFNFPTAGFNPKPIFEESLIYEQELSWNF